MGFRSLFPKSGREAVLYVALIATLVYPLRRYVAGGAVDPVLLTKDMSGKVILITGANTGIGYETALQMATQHAAVVMACRSESRCNAAADAIRTAVSDAKVDTMQLDLSDLTSVEAFSDEFLKRYNQLDVLVNNAGVMHPPFSLTKQGHELTIATNHFGPFALTNRLLPLILVTPNSRIVIVSSLAHERGTIDFDDLNFEKRGYGFGVVAYMQSKLANVLHAKELARLLQGTGVSVVSLHPGVIHTELTRTTPVISVLEKPLYPILHTIAMKSAWEGAQTTLFAILDDSIPSISGAYLSDCAVKKSPNALVENATVAKQLWDISEKVTGTTFPRRQ